MQNNFDLKKFLVENKLTPASQMSEVTVKGKKVKTYKQNGDKSYSIEYVDGTKDTIAVSHDDWDAVNDDNLEKNTMNEGWPKPGDKGFEDRTQEEINLYMKYSQDPYTYHLGPEKIWKMVDSDMDQVQYDMSAGRLPKGNTFTGY